MVSLFFFFFGLVDPVSFIDFNLTVQEAIGALI